MQGRYYEAIRSYKDSLELDTKQPMILVNLGTTYLKQDRIGLALGTFRAVLELDPHLAVAHERMGYCMFLRKQYGQAEERYRQALGYDDGLASAHAGLGVTKMAQFLRKREDAAMRDEAVECWHRSLEVDPDQPRIRKLIAKYRMRPLEEEQILLGQ